jgi:CheY-like chemotaxis protein
MATSTVVVAREDLTIPGAVEASGLDTIDPEHIENELFKTLEQNKADAVLLDLTASRGQGVAAIRRIRRRSAVPILVVCRPEDRLAADYRRAGAAACLNPPIDLMQMKEALGLPDASNRRGMAPLFVSAAAEGIRFSGYVLRPRDNRLIGPDEPRWRCLRSKPGSCYTSPRHRASYGRPRRSPKPPRPGAPAMPTARSVL